MTTVAEIMSKDTKLIGPTDTIQRAAQLMKETDCGILPVQDGDRLAGMITDRDIAIRCIAAGRGPDTKVSEAMSEEVLYCYDGDDITDVCQNMAENQVRRLPVMNQDKRLVGIVSLSDLARKDPNCAKALEGITQPGDQHNQS